MRRERHFQFIYHQTHISPEEGAENDSLQVLRPLEASTGRVIVSHVVGFTELVFAVAVIARIPLDHHFSDGNTQADSHRVSVDDGQEAHDRQNDALRNDKACQR